MPYVYFQNQKQMLNSTPQILALLTIFLLYRNHWIAISGGRKSEICEPLRAACFVKAHMKTISEKVSCLN